MNYISLVQRYPNFISYGALHYFFSSLGQTFLISLFVPHFLSTLSLTNLEFGWLYSGATLTGALVLPVLGNLLDRVKLRYMSMGIGLLLGLFCFFIAGVWHPAALFLALIGLRLLGQGMLPLTASTAIARYFEVNRGKALSLAGFGVSAGEFFLPLTLTGIMAYMGWENTWMLLGASVWLLFIPASIGLVHADSPFQSHPVPADTSREGQGHAFDRKAVLRDPRFYGLVGVYLFVPFFMTGILIQQSAIGTLRQWSPELMAYGISAFGVTRLATNLLAGPMVDRFTAVKVFPFMLIPMLIGTAFLTWLDHGLTPIVFFAFCGISNGIAGLSNTAVWAEVYGTRHFGAIRSMVSTFMVFSTAIAPVVLAWGVVNEVRLTYTLMSAITTMALLTGLGFAIVRGMTRARSY